VSLKFRSARNDAEKGFHCEERSDDAISTGLTQHQRVMR
jgi:hypothetical protein